MTRSLAAIAALVLAVAGCAGASSPSAPSIASSPSASPAATATSSVPVTPSPSVEATVPIPDVLLNVWIGPARDIPAIGGPLPLSIIRFRGVNFDFIFGEQGEEALNSTVSVSAPGQIRFTSANLTGGCRLGDEGLYDWTTTADGAGLSIAKVADACTPRGEAVVGDWVRAACKEFGCLGNVAAGVQQTAWFEPLGQPAGSSGSWRMQYGQLSYTVPAGWANAVDAPTFYNIVPQVAYAKPASDEMAYPGISLVADAAVSAQDAACTANVEPDVGKGAGEIAARIARIPSLRVSAPTKIKIAGRSATMLDVALTPSWDQFCSVGGGVPVIRENIPSDASEWRMTTAGRWRLILLDVAKGRTMAILIDAFDEPSRFDDIVTQAMPIVTSFEFHPPTP